jgi:hypothetical protein
MVSVGHITSDIGVTAKNTATTNVAWTNSKAADIKDYLEDYMQRSSGATLVISSGLLMLSAVISMMKYF